MMNINNKDLQMLLKENEEIGTYLSERFTIHRFDEEVSNLLSSINGEFYPIPDIVTHKKSNVICLCGTVVSKKVGHCPVCNEGISSVYQLHKNIFNNKEIVRVKEAILCTENTNELVIEFIIHSIFYNEDAQQFEYEKLDNGIRFNYTSHTISTTKGKKMTLYDALQMLSFLHRYEENSTFVLRSHEFEHAVINSKRKVINYADFISKLRTKFFVNYYILNEKVPTRFFVKLFNECSNELSTWFNFEAKEVPDFYQFSKNQTILAVYKAIKETVLQDKYIEIHYHYVYLVLRSIQERLENENIQLSLEQEDFLCSLFEMISEDLVNEFSSFKENRISNLKKIANNLFLLITNSSHDELFIYFNERLIQQEGVTTLNHAIILYRKYILTKKLTKTTLYPMHIKSKIY